MEVSRAISWVCVIWVAWRDSGRGMVSGEMEVVCVGKCGEVSKGRRAPPSRERETWILVSLVIRERECVRRCGRVVGIKIGGSLATEPMVESYELDLYQEINCSGSLVEGR